MTTTVEEPKTKSQKRRKAAQAEDAVVTTNTADAGGQPSTDSPELDLSQLFAELGFEVLPPVIEQWGPETRKQIERTGKRWKEEFDAAAFGTPLPPEDRTEVPPLLAALEAVSTETATTVKKIAEQMRGQGRTVNPYPPGSAVAKIWQDAFDAAPGASIRVELEPVVAAGFEAIVAEQAANREATRKADQVLQHEIAIEEARVEVEESSAHVAELEDEIDEKKAEMGELTASLKSARKRSSKASRNLVKVRSGVFERTLPFPRDAKPAGLEVPDQDIGAAPAKPKVDEGAFISLDHLVKGDLQEFIPGTPEDRGLSAKQVETLKEAVGGETIGDLEKFQQAKGQWWTKEINGFGKETVTKLQDAQEVIRRKFPIPDPDDVETEEPALPMNCDEARQAIREIISMCSDVEQGTVNLDGVRFVRDVSEKASGVFGTIKDLEGVDVTPKQAEAIRAWRIGVVAWHEKLEDEGEDSEDEDDEGDE